MLGGSPDASDPDVPGRTSWAGPDRAVDGKHFKINERLKIPSCSWNRTSTGQTVAQNHGDKLGQIVFWRAPSMDKRELWKYF
jgi:hypothetical protein